MIVALMQVKPPAIFSQWVPGELRGHASRATKKTPACHGHPGLRPPSLSLGSGDPCSLLVEHEPHLVLLVDVDCHLA
ncbi:MAG: hypothetical protein OEZ08_05100, partial [Betaproteobacteria bacterium]|nr:hypothetical protein [Betaproteobacteria bacterium]